MDALDALRDRLAELSDLGAIGRLANWDARTMMPEGGGPARATQLATLERLAHERGTDAAIGEWLDEIEGSGDGTLTDVDRDLVRLARRDFDRQRRVPVDLAAELAQAGAEGQSVWQTARAESSFAAFAPALRRNIDLSRSYAACFEAEHPYDALLADYDHGLTVARLRDVFGELAEALPPLVAAATERPAVDRLDVPVPAQEAGVRAALERVGVTDDSWRVDVSAHPFTSWVSTSDIRLTTRYEDGQLESVLAAMHEFGHGLYERQIDPALMRTNLAMGTSMSMHESQSKLWENHVGRHPAFASVIAAGLAQGGFDVSPADLHAALVQVRPSLIRVSADPLTYPLHIVLRFELEVALLEGSLDVADLPAAWNDGMHRLLGVDVPDDASGVLQDVHWAAGAFGYFPSYALGVLAAAQLWERLEADLGDRSAALADGEVGAIRDWLAENVHRHGRRVDTEPLLQQVTGCGLSVGPFLAHASAHVTRS